MSARLDPTGALPPGTVILSGRYRVQRRLGSGAFGQVYLVQAVDGGEALAVKVLHQEMDGVGSSAIATYQERFDLECWLAKQVRHPNVIRVLESVTQGDGLYAIMDFAPNGSLADLLEREGSQPIDRVVRLVADAARGLTALHAIDAVHRDLKPANILIAADGSAKVADLGLAQVPGRQGSGRSWRGSGAGPHPGTPDYMSPEHRHPDALPLSADVYSLGCVAFELLTGRVWKQARRDADCVRDLRPEVPLWLDRVIMRMLVEEPGVGKADRSNLNKRYVDMTDLLIDLAAGDHAGAEVVVPPVSPVSTPGPIAVSTSPVSPDPIPPAPVPLHPVLPPPSSALTRRLLLGGLIGAAALIGLVTWSPGLRPPSDGVQPQSTTIDTESPSDVTSEPIPTDPSPPRPTPEPPATIPTPSDRTGPGGRVRTITSSVVCTVCDCIDFECDQDAISEAFATCARAKGASDEAVALMQSETMAISDFHPFTAVDVAEASDPFCSAGASWQDVVLLNGRRVFQSVLELIETNPTWQAEAGSLKDAGIQSVNYVDGTEDSNGHLTLQVDVLFRDCGACDDRGSARFELRLDAYASLLSLRVTSVSVAP